MRSSRLPGFYKMDVEARRELVSTVTETTSAEIADAVDHGGLDAETADKLVEIFRTTTEKNVKLQALTALTKRKDPRAAQLMQEWLSR